LIASEGLKHLLDCPADTVLLRLLLGVTVSAWDVVIALICTLELVLQLLSGGVPDDHTIPE